MHPSAIHKYLFPAPYLPADQDSNSIFDKLLPPARGWTGIAWYHCDDELAVQAKIASAARQTDCESVQNNLLAENGNAVQEMRALFSRLELHFLAIYGESGAVIRAHMLFQAYGPVRNVDPKVLFSEDADGDAWSGAIDSLKS